MLHAHFEVEAFPHTTLTRLRQLCGCQWLIVSWIEKLPQKLPTSATCKLRYKDQHRWYFQTESHYFHHMLNVPSSDSLISFHIQPLDITNRILIVIQIPDDTSYVEANVSKYLDNVTCADLHNIKSSCLRNWLTTSTENFTVPAILQLLELLSWLLLPY